MANGPLGGFMPTPAAPSQPPSVKVETTADSRGNFSNFLKNMNGAALVDPPVVAPAMGAMTPNIAPASNIATKFFKWWLGSVWSRFTKRFSRASKSKDKRNTSIFASHRRFCKRKIWR